MEQSSRLRSSNFGLGGRDSFEPLSFPDVPEVEISSASALFMKALSLLKDVVWDTETKEKSMFGQSSYSEDEP